MSVREVLTDMEYGPAPTEMGRVRAWLRDREAGGGDRDSGEVLCVRDPARGDALAEVRRGTAADLDRAVAAAREAQTGWSALPGGERGRHLRALADLVGQRAEFLAVLETLQHGIPVGATLDGVARAARCLREFGGWAEVGEDAAPDRLPWGVCAAAFAPSRPICGMARKVAPALAAGNALLLMPGREAPLTALALAELCREAGLPDGLVTFVAGDEATVGALARHPGVDRFDVAGPAEIRRAAALGSAGTGKRLAPDPGARALFLVFADADLDAAVEGVVEAAWSGGAEAGISGLRVLVAEGVETAFVERLEARMGRTRAGDPLDRNSEAGVTIRPERVETIRRLLEEGASEGAVLHEAGAAAGAVRPLVLAANVAPANPLWSAEALEAVVTVTSFRTSGEALDLAATARETPLAAIWSENVNLCLDAAAGLRAPHVGINSASPFEGGEAADAEGYLRAVVSPPAGSAGAGRPPAAAAAAGPEAREAVRRAVASAAAAGGWSALSSVDRAAALRAFAESLSDRKADLAARLVEDGAAADAAAREVEATVRRARWYVAWAYHAAGCAGLHCPSRLVLRLRAPVGIVGVLGPADPPLLGPLSLALPALAAGNRAVVAGGASRACRDGVGGSGLPADALGLVTGDSEALAGAMARHGGIGALWYVGPAAGQVETACAEDLKEVWTEAEGARDWTGPQGQGRDLLNRATRWRTVRLAYGA